MMITIIGTGYVGLVTGACLADFGLQVICVDKDSKKIEQLKSGLIPIYEPGLDVIVEKNIKENRLIFETNLRDAVAESEVIFIAVGTPSDEDGSADLTHVKEVAEEISQYMDCYKIIVNKSTVPVGTGNSIKRIIAQGLSKKGQSIEFDVVSNPEFLREGSAIYDFTHPDRVVIGCENEKAAQAMKDVYRVLYLNETPFLITNLESAELIKYASNAFLAMKITFINEIANLCEQVGADIKDVAKGIGKDGRIGSKFLHPGPGYGGSCFPKDTKALAHIGRFYGEPCSLVETTIEVNEKQKTRVVEKILSLFDGELRDKRICILGLSFKPNTDDMREAPAIKIVNELNRHGAHIKLYDPVAMNEAKGHFSELTGIEFCTDEYSAMLDADAVVIVTEWNQFRNLDFNKFKKLTREPNLFDLRNIYRRKQLEQMGIIYFGVGQ